MRHRFPILVKGVFEERSADKIHPGNRVVVSEPLAAYSVDEQSCLFGAFLAEGTYVRTDARCFDKSRGRNRVVHQYRITFSICTDERDFREFIICALTKAYPSAGIYELRKKGTKSLAISISQRDAVQDFKSKYDAFVGSEDLTAAQKASFLRGFFEGDGGVNIYRNTVQFNQSTKNSAKVALGIQISE